MRRAVEDVGIREIIEQRDNEIARLRQHNDMLVGKLRELQDHVASLTAAVDLSRGQVALLCGKLEAAIGDPSSAREAKHSPSESVAPVRVFPYLGVSVRAADIGICVTEVRNSAAAAGLCVGDILLSAQQTKQFHQFRTVDDYRAFTCELLPDAVITLEVARPGVLHRSVQVEMTPALFLSSDPS